MKKFLISFIALLMGVVIGVGIWHGIAYKDKIKVFADKTWSKIESLFKKDNKQDEQNPTPSEEQINLDGLYYINVDGDYSFVQIKDSKYGIIEGYIQDSKIYLASDWESSVELNPFHTTEDDKFLHVFVTDQVNSNEYKIAIYDKTSKTLYYDFSNGQQIPGETYEDQLLSEMIKFDEYEISDSSSEVCEHDWVEDLSYVPTAPSCGEYWDKQYKCSKCNETKLETNGPLPHDYVNGVCTRCGESDPNYVEEVASIDGLYYRARTDGTIDVFQIQDAKYVTFVGYTQNGDESKIYFPQDWTTYLGGFGNSLTIEENDTQIICGVPELMEQYKDYPELYEAFSNYFVYDKETKELRFGMNKVILTRIDAYNILPYEEPRISIENDILHMTDMTGVDGTYTVYYRNSSTVEEGAYVAGNVTEFDLTTLFNHDPKLVSGDEYTIRVVFATTDGFLIQGYESIQYTVPNGETALTWQFNINSSFTFPSDSTIIFQDNFTSNGESFDQIQLTHGEPPYDFYTRMTYINSTTSTNKVVFDGSNAWESYGEAYRTITFETAPTGDLLAWLQANATPQA